MVKSISALGLCLLACLNQVQGGSNVVTRAVTARHSSLPVSITASGDSVFPRLSGDGRFVAFMSNAGNLVSNRNGGKDFDIFVRDRMSGTTALVSVAANGVEGGNGLSTLGDISADGRYVVFESEANNLVPGDTNGESDIFIRDLVLERTKLISQTASGTIGNGRSVSPFMTPDARRVLFETSAPNLIPGAPEAGRRLVLWDADASSLWLISASLTVPQFFDPTVATPAMSTNGNLVAFVTDATNVVAGTPPKLSQVYVRDLETGRTTWASEVAATLLAPVKVNFVTPVLSGDGKRLFFVAWASTRGTWIFEHDLSSGTARIIVADTISTVSTLSIEGVNPAGTHLLYQLDGQIYLRRTAEPAPVLISVNKLGTGPAKGLSQNAVISKNGAHVIFMSDATDLPDAGGTGFQLYHRDLRTDQTTRLSARPDGLPGADLNEVLPAISADARWVAFESTDEGLVKDDLNDASDVFIVDAGAPVVELISGRDATLPSTAGGNQSSGYLAALPAGRQPPGAFDQTGTKLFFRSDATDLLANGTNQAGYAGLFIHTVDTSTSTEVARETVPVMDGHFWSADGLKVAYFARVTPPAPFARPLVAGVVKDLAANVIQAVTILPTGEYETPAPGSPLSLSADGNWLAFRSTANGTFLRDLKNGKTTKADLTTSGVLTHQLSPDGRYLAQVSRSLEFWDTRLNRRFEISINNSELDGRLAFSTSGNILVLNGIQRPIRDEVIRPVYLYSVPNRRLLLEYPTRRTGRLAWNVSGEPMLSGNGRFLALVDETDKPALGDTNRVADIYVFDLVTQETRLVSVNQSGTRAGNAASTYPSISRDGRYVTFLSLATDLTSEATGRGDQVFMRDLWLGKTILVSKSAHGSRGSDGRADSPAVSPTGRHVAYVSEALDLTTGDFNGHRDIYLAELPDSPALADADGDGLPDVWERVNLGTLDRNGADDPDEDGISNLVEYQTGGNPLDELPAKFLRIVRSQENVILVWRSRPGLAYEVQRSLSLNQPVWETVVRKFSPADETTSFITPYMPGAVGAYYRLIQQP